MELRLYSFVNYYLSPMQQGIQTGHVAVDLVRKYTNSSEMTNVLVTYKSRISEKRIRMVEDWADSWKTFIVLNGGNYASVKAASMIISNSGFPWTCFCEDEQSLDGMQTCVAVVVPENVFNARKVDAEVPGEKHKYVSTVENADGTVDNYEFTEFNVLYPLIELIRSSRLAS